MADTLHSLLSTKAALDLGLVSEDDYNAVKTAFLRAQQVRAALDAGLVKEDDYEATKQQYLSTLISEGTAVPSRLLPPDVHIGATTLRNLKLQRTEEELHPRSTVNLMLQQAAPRQHERQEPSAGLPTTMQNSYSLDVPVNIPNVGGAKGIASGVSMSGISVTPDAVNLYYLIRAKSTYRWALWAIDDACTQVVISAVGGPGATYADFMAALPECDCRYGVFDYRFTASDGHVMNKLVFFNWAPDAARVKAKMMYASTKDFFKGHLDGLSAEFQASDLSDINEQEVGEAVRALKR